MQWPEMTFPPINLYTAPHLMELKKQQEVRGLKSIKRASVRRAADRQGPSLEQLLAMPR